MHGESLPPTVSLNDLVAGGYLNADDVRAFEGIQVTVSTGGTNASPQRPLIHARMPDGTVIALLADGSVQQLRK